MSQLLHKATPSRLGEVLSNTQKQTVKQNEEQRTMFQIEEQGKTSEKDFNETD